MQTRHFKGREGYQAETNIPLPELGLDRFIKLSTYKSSRKGVQTVATVVKIHADQLGFSYVMFHDYSKTRAHNTELRCTEKTVAAQHAAVLSELDALLQDVRQFYMAKGEFPAIELMAA